MNIFASSPDPTESARALDDRRLNKMIVESAQILCTALHLNGCATPELYRPAYTAHPVVRWAAADPRNFAWLYRHFCALLDERCFRIAKAEHACRRLLPALVGHVRTVESPDHFVNCTPYKDVADVHAAYRQVLAEKWAGDHPAPTWLRRGQPDFAPAISGCRSHGVAQ
ncbi:MAG TPA: pyrimidine dimer DNA glycosylase/endonuclease V [Alphaproteobacteria bacterium]|nr:pyrimidine dimer DNA glycosylase/endonuclease V [Alphaproteobacteria bacterium]